MSAPGRPMRGVVLVGNGGHARACVDAWSLDPQYALAGYVGPAPAGALGLSYLGDDDALESLARRRG